MPKRQLLMLAVLLLIGGGWAFLYREKIKAAWREWFYAPMHPMTLAIFRAVIFLELFISANPRISMEYASLPKTLQYPPLIANMFDWNPTPGGMQTTLLIYQIACVLGFLGLFTRTSAWVAVITGVYVLGVPQLFGKVNHSHHMIWFALLIACGPPSLALSIDGIFQAWRRADRGDVDAPKPDFAHGLPIKIAICMMGLMYFFPGLWKVLAGGPEWVTPLNTARIMHGDWLMMGHWMPVVRLDGMPIVLFLGSVGTIVFELLFFPLAIFRRTRWMAALGGLAFHNMTYLNLGIRFGTVQAMYVIFIDWFEFLRKVGRRIWKTPLYVVYDGDCRFCRRVLASIKTLEYFDQLAFVNGQAVDELPDGTPIPYTREQRLQDIYAYEDGTWHTGDRVYARLARRVPKLWVFVPFLSMKAISGAIYRRMADNRHLLIGEKKEREPLKLSTLPLSVVGTALFVSVFILGVRDKYNAWPIASYPTYEAVNAGYVHHIGYFDGEKTHVPQFDPELRERFMPNRLNGLFSAIRQDQDEAHQRAALVAFWNLWKPGKPLPAAVELESDTDPAQWKTPSKVLRVIPLQ